MIMLTNVYLKMTVKIFLNGRFILFWRS